jgi:transcriptional regulator with XRE-family HTH domain
MTASQGLGPAIPRRRFGAELRRLRTEQGKLLGQVAKELMISTSKLSRLEKGHGAPQDRDVRDLLEYYQLTGTELGDRMWRWALEGRETPWWHEAPEPVPPAIDQYLQYETAASLIRGYATFVPSLLQTAGYAQALVTAMDTVDPEEVASHVDLRIRRQSAISRDEYPVSLDTILDESVFHRMVGTAATMREQLISLANASELPTVSLRVFPFAAGPHPALREGAFSVFEFRRNIDQDVVYIESEVADSYIDQPEQVERYRRLLDGLSARSLDPTASAGFIRRMSDSYLHD